MNMKYRLTIIFLLVTSIIAQACPVCDKQQPKILRGITHGTGPESQWDYLIISIMVIVVLFTLFYSVKWLIYPGETSPNHVKQHILNDD